MDIKDIENASKNYIVLSNADDKYSQDDVRNAFEDGARWMMNKFQPHSIKLELGKYYKASIGCIIYVKEMYDDYNFACVLYTNSKMDFGTYPYIIHIDQTFSIEQLMCFDNAANKHGIAAE